MRKLWLLLLPASYVAMPRPAFAGPICSDLWSCLPLALPSLLLWYGGTAALVFGLLSAIQYLRKRRRFAGRGFAIALICSLILAPLVVPLIAWPVDEAQKHQADLRYNSREQAAARDVHFSVFQPSYLPRGYKLSENRVTASGSGEVSVIFDYERRTAGERSDATAADRYSITEWAATPGAAACSELFSKVVGACSRVAFPGGTYFIVPSDSQIRPDVSEVELLRGETYVNLKFTMLSEPEIGRVLASLTKVDPQNVTYRSDWAELR